LKQTTIDSNSLFYSTDYINPIPKAIDTKNNNIPTVVSVIN